MPDQRLCDHSGDVALSVDIAILFQLSRQQPKLSIVAVIAILPLIVAGALRCHVSWLPDFAPLGPGESVSYGSRWRLTEAFLSRSRNFILHFRVSGCMADTSSLMGILNLEVRHSPSETHNNVLGCRGFAFRR